jgi:hypothetical protein
MLGDLSKKIKSIKHIAAKGRNQNERMTKGDMSLPQNLPWHLRTNPTNPREVKSI